MGFIKGLGVGLIIAGLADYIGMVPYIGPSIAPIKMWFFLLLGLVCFYFGGKAHS